MIGALQPRLSALALLFCLLLLTATACGGKQPVGQSDPLSLLREGRHTEARIMAVERGLDNDAHRAIVALTYIAGSPVESSAKLAVRTLNKDAGNVRTAAVAAEMLTLVGELPPPVSPEVSLLSVEAALGAVGYGPYAPGTKPTLTVGAASRALSRAVLERVAAALSGCTASMERQLLIQIWNASYSLDGGSFEAANAHLAWRLFTSISTIALHLASSQPTGNLTNALLGAAVTAVASNPEIAIAVKCDIASPYDDLKKALAYKHDLLVRLETSLQNATGCSRGAYAPPTP